SADTMYLYQNGVLVDSDTNASFEAIDSPTATFFGDYLDNTGTLHTYGNVKIDEVRIYDTALSATEIQNLYANSKYTQINTPQNNKLTDGLVGYWTFNGPDMTSTTALDVSGSGNHGTR